MSSLVQQVSLSQDLDRPIRPKGTAGVDGNASDDTAGPGLFRLLFSRDIRNYMRACKAFRQTNCKL